MRAVPLDLVNGMHTSLSDPHRDGTPLTIDLSNSPAVDVDDSLKRYEIAITSI